MERILINDFDGLLKFLSKVEISTNEVRKVIADSYGVYADPTVEKEEVLKGFAHLWNNYHLKGLEMPLFI